VKYFQVSYLAADAMKKDKAAFAACHITIVQAAEVLSLPPAICQAPIPFRVMRIVMAVVELIIAPLVTAASSSTSRPAKVKPVFPLN